MAKLLRAGRDRAIVLLLPRLGLRAGDVAQLRLSDIEWETGSLRVSGKSRYEVRLPLPQDVGDAIAAYLECRPSTCPSDHVFLRTIAHCRPFRRGDGISRRSMKESSNLDRKMGLHRSRQSPDNDHAYSKVPLLVFALNREDPHRRLGPALGVDTRCHRAFSQSSRTWTLTTRLSAAA